MVQQSRLKFTDDVYTYYNLKDGKKITFDRPITNPNKKVLKVENI